MGNNLDGHAHPWTNMSSHYLVVSSIKKPRNQSTPEWAFLLSASNYFRWASDFWVLLSSFGHVCRIWQVTELEQIEECVGRKHFLVFQNIQSLKLSSLISNDQEKVFVFKEFIFNDLFCLKNKLCLGGERQNVKFKNSFLAKLAKK